ncbi:MAG: hypothetical protein ACOX66_04985 [Oscillospiraceae bacterium]|jgi:hypothetical protein
MDEKQMEKQIKKAKRANYIIFALAAALLAAIAVGIIAELNRPFDKAVKKAGLAGALQNTQILAKADGAYYRFDGSEDFAALLQFDAWKKCDRVYPSDEIVTFHLGRQYSLTLYGDGHAVAANGYAKKGSRGEAFYEIPETVARAVADAVEASGEKMDFEEGVTASMTMDSATESED